MAAYTLHLGFTWGSPPIGAIWSATPGENYFLQYALADDNGLPAWFTLFDLGDALTVVVWDMTPANSEITIESVQLGMGFAPLIGTADTDALPPGELVYVDPAVASPTTKPVNGELQSCLSYATVTLVSGGRGPWGDASASYSMGPIVFAKETRYKLSFYVEVSARSSSSGRVLTNNYLSDPEVIVGSKGHP